MRPPRGMTILELMIVIAIIGAAVLLARSGFRMITKADLVEDSTELAAVMKRTSQLAIEKGELHRIVLDFEKTSCATKPHEPDQPVDHCYYVEVCQGTYTITKNEQVSSDEEAAKRALDKGKERMKGVPVEALAADPEVATKQALTLAGHHIADRMCQPATDSVTGDSKGGTWFRFPRAGKVKFKEVWVQHKDDSTTKGQVAIYFFPNGASEKAVIELTDGSETFSILVWGLTGRIQLRDGVLSDVNDHMLRNVMGDKDKPRENE